MKNFFKKHEELCYAILCVISIAFLIAIGTGILHIMKYFW